MTENELWSEVERFFETNFDTEPHVAIETVLFLIGVQELGSGKQKYSKEDKLNLIHIAVCRLLEPYGFYEFSHYDDAGYPHFKVKAEMPELKPNEQTILMKKAVVQYFIDENLFSQEVLDSLSKA